MPQSFAAPVPRRRAPEVEPLEVDPTPVDPQRQVGDAVGVDPPVRYVRAGDTHLAYQVTGAVDGSTGIDLVFVPEWVSHLETTWEEPAAAAFLGALSAFSRLILFDKRGVGLSDPVPIEALGSLEDWIDDVVAVLDAVGSTKTVLAGTGAGGQMVALAAALHPERVQSLVLLNSTARIAAAPDYPAGWPPASLDDMAETTRDRWGTGWAFGVGAPTLEHDTRAREAHARRQRLSASPGVALAMQRMLIGSDIREAVATIHVPTLVLHRRGNRMLPVEHGRYLASAIPGARLVELNGDDHLWWAGDWRALVSEIREFVTGVREPAAVERALASILFTDIVGSTSTAARRGDAAWIELLARHDEAIRRQLERFRGRQVKHTGDGVVATFDGPARAIRCACAIREALHAIGIEISAGIHVGEIELGARGELHGIAMHIAARVEEHTAAGEIRVSRTVTDLVAGSGIEFEDRRAVELKGVPGEWELARVRC